MENSSNSPKDYMYFPYIINSSEINPVQINGDINPHTRDSKNDS